MITISGLTKAQVNLLDQMWAIDSYQEYTEWKESQTEEVMNEIDTLEEMVLLAELDSIQDDECGKANTELKRIMAL